MVEVVFEYNHRNIPIQANLQDKFQVIIYKYLQKSPDFSLDARSLIFTCNGFPLDPTKTVESHMLRDNKQTKKMIVLVNQAYVEKSKPVIIQSKDIICPKCYETCTYKIENYKIKLYDCINNHITDNIKIKDFPSTQEIDISKIKCSKCPDKNKGNSTDNEFYKCITCSKNLCLLCKTIHNLDHYIVKYELKDFICKKHKDFFIKYCKNCKINLCMICDQEHTGHKTIYFGDIMPNNDELKKNYYI